MRTEKLLPERTLTCQRVIALVLDMRTPCTILPELPRPPTSAFVATGFRLLIRVHLIYYYFNAEIKFNSIVSMEIEGLAF